MSVVVGVLVALLVIVISALIYGGGLALAGYVAYRLDWRGLRLRRGLCVECGYNLTGNVSGVCPECGTPVQAI